MTPVAAPFPSLNLHLLIRILRRRLLVVVSLGLLVPAILLALRLGQEPRYAASSEVLISRDNLAATLTRGQASYTDAQTAERRIETQLQLARVPALAERVVAAAGPVSGTPAEFLARSSAEAKPNADILVLTVEDPSPSLATRLAGLYGEEFSKYRRELDAAELEAVAQSVRKELDALRAGPTTPLQQDLQEKLREIQTLQALQTTSAVVVRQPDSADRVGAEPMSVAAGGLGIGLLLGIGVALVLELLETRVASSEEIAEHLHLPLLGRLPEPRSLRDQSTLIMVENPQSDEGEAFSLLRTTLEFANARSRAQVIMFSSAIEEEGKSTTVANLAVACARAGTRVVLLDLDLRRPSIDGFFGISRAPGITEVARGEVRLEEAVVDVPLLAAGDDDLVSPTPSLHVLPSGRPSHSIDVDAVGAVIDRLRGQYELVFVDTPPLLQVGDAMALTAKVDGLVVVARLNYVRRRTLDELRRVLDTVPSAALGYVVTGASEEVGYAGYYHYTYSRAGGDDGDDRTSPMPVTSISRAPSPEEAPTEPRARQPVQGQPPPRQEPEGLPDDPVPATLTTAVASDAPMTPPAPEQQISDPAPVAAAPTVTRWSREEVLAAVFGSHVPGAGLDRPPTRIDGEDRSPLFRPRRSWSEDPLVLRPTPPLDADAPPPPREGTADEH